MALLSDQIQDFIDWLESNTDFGDWDDKVKIEVHKKLIYFLISGRNESTTPFPSNLTRPTNN